MVFTTNCLAFKNSLIKRVKNTSIPSLLKTLKKKVGNTFETINLNTSRILRVVLV